MNETRQQECTTDRAPLLVIARVFAWIGLLALAVFLQTCDVGPAPAPHNTPEAAE